MKTEATAQVHRFHDTVAMHTTNMDNTIYLDAKMARDLALQLLAFASDISACPKFSESTMATVTLPLAEPEEIQEGDSRYFRPD